MVSPREMKFGPVNWELVEQARATSPVARMLDGARLFDAAVMMMKAGLQSEHPEADDREILELLRKRLDTIERMEQRR